MPRATTVWLLTTINLKPAVWRDFGLRHSATNERLVPRHQIGVRDQHPVTIQKTAGLELGVGMKMGARRSRRRNV